MGASKHEVQAEIATVLYSTRADKNNSNNNKPAVHMDFADSPLRLLYVDDGHELPGARDTLEMPPFASIPNQHTRRARAAKLVQHKHIQ
jgi:hypothetical protein